MSNTDQFADLWPKFQALFPDKDHTRFKRDGIIEPTLFIGAPIRPLYILKEGNDDGNPENEHDYRLWLKDGLAISNTYKKCTGDWTHGILNNFPDYNSITDIQRKDAILRAAYINIKKWPGGGTEVVEETDRVLNACKDLLVEQIERINPTHIICGLSKTYRLKTLFKEEMIQLPGLHRYEWRGRNIYDFYHMGFRHTNGLSFEKVYNILKERF